MNKYMEQGFKNTPDYATSQQYGWHMNIWEVGGVTSMASLFEGNTDFNEEIGSQDMSSVTTMNSMFKDVIAFDQDISSWITSKVTNIHGTFGGASSVNQGVSN